jgi:hypothetical protein
MTLLWGIIGALNVEMYGKKTFPALLSVSHRHHRGIRPLEILHSSHNACSIKFTKDGVGRVPKHAQAGMVEELNCGQHL